MAGLRSDGLSPVRNVFWSAPGYLTIGLFQMQAVTQDATNTYIQTNEVGGFPALASPIFYRTHPASQFTCDACTGDPAVVATNVQSGATPLAPLGHLFASELSHPPRPRATSAVLSCAASSLALRSTSRRPTLASGPAILRPTGQFHHLHDQAIGLEAVRLVAHY